MIEGIAAPEFRSPCEGGSTCVEVAILPVLVRDGKDPNGPMLVFTVAEWREFVSGVKRGEFDVG